MHNLKSFTKITSLNSSLNCLKWSPLSFQCHKCSTRPRHIKKPAWGPRFINGGVRLHPYSVFWLWFPSSFCMTIGATHNQDKPNQARDKQQCTFSNWQERKMPKLIIVRVYLNCNICLGKAKIMTNKSTPPQLLPVHTEADSWTARVHNTITVPNYSPGSNTIWHTKRIALV